MGLPDAFGVVATTTLASLISEVILYFWVYRTPGFKSVKDAVQRQTRRGAAAGGPLKAKSGREKKLERKDSTLKRDVGREVAVLRFKAGIVMVVMIFTLYKGMNVLYYGKTVAKLPFEPFRLLRGVTHRGLDAEPITDCAMAFILMLCQTGLRPNLVLLLGWGPSRKMNTMGSVLPQAQDIANR